MPLSPYLNPWTFVIFSLPYLAEKGSDGAALVGACHPVNPPQCCIHYNRMCARVHEELLMQKNQNNTINKKRVEIFELPNKALLLAVIF